ncbi:MAG: PepSY-like domain-containing protein [Prevotella sp.]|nr:PepSY-like domain-containing protein [Prevotella sp.]
MKKSRLFIAALACFFMQSVSTFADDMIIPASQLPAAATNFVKTNFPGQVISYASVDRDFSGTKYEVTLNNGVELDFDKSGTWDKVDCNFSAVPANLVPANIANYVKTNFPGTSIIKIDKERYGYDIELSNDLELKFNKKGQLMNIDD